MKRFLIASLILSSLLHLNSCKTYVKVNNEDLLKISEFTSPFDSSFNKILFNTKIYFYKKYFTGLLFIKQTSENNFRLVFISEIGKKIFDFTLNNNTFKVEYILPAIDKPILIKTLKKDFSLMLFNDFNKSKKIKINSEDSIITLKFKTEYGKTFALYKNKKLISINSSNKIRKIIDIKYLDYKNKLPQEINIDHKNIKLIINLKTIKQDVD